MNKLVFPALLLLSALAACDFSSTDEATGPNQAAGGSTVFTGSGGALPATGGAPAATGGAPAAMYPAGPYGFKVGETIANLAFTNSAGQTVQLSELRAQTGVKVILWSSGAEWCSICKVQAPKLSSLFTSKKSRGLLVFETLHQSSDGKPADAATLTRWKAALSPSYELYVEKSPNYAGHTDNPLELVIDAQTMKVKYRQVHTTADLSVHVDAALKGAQ